MEHPACSACLRAHGTFAPPFSGTRLNGIRSQESGIRSQVTGAGVGQTGNYPSATRHPWSCLVFVLPLLLIYEVGLHFLGANSAETLRNGADAWFRLGLAYIGMKDWFWA